MISLQLEPPRAVGARTNLRFVTPRKDEEATLLLDEAALLEAEER